MVICIRKNTKIYKMNIKFEILIEILIVVLIYFKTSVTELTCDYRSDQKWHVFGIYSACYNNTNRTKLNGLAEDLDQIVGYMWKLKATDFYDEEDDFIKRRLNVTYVSVDVCNNFERVVEIVDMIHLDREYHYATWFWKTRQVIHMSSVLAIYAELPTKMMEFLRDSFVGDIRFTGNSVSFNASVNSELYKIYASILHHMTYNRFKWERLLILNVLPSTMIPLYELFIQRYHGIRGVREIHTSPAKLDYKQ